MIKGRIKKTDNYSIEIKMMFRPRRRRFHSREMYSVETWFFLPFDMGINKRNYTKIDFYRELKSYIKIDPPKALITEIAAKSGDFMVKFDNAFKNYNPSEDSSSDNLIDLMLIFLNITKKAIKRELRKIDEYKVFSEKVRVTTRLIKSLDLISKDFRGQIKTTNAFNHKKLIAAFEYADEYISNLKYRYYQHLIFTFEKEKIKDTDLMESIKASLEKEISHRKKNDYPIVTESNKENDKLLRRWDEVKFFVTNKLILNPRVDKEMRYVLEVLYSIAAGVAMIFATGIAFYYGKKFGNFTYAFFVVLVVSYMFKDRIKEWSRNLFNTIMKKQMLDHRFSLYDNNQKKIGISYSGFSFIPKRNLPKEIYQLHYGNIKNDLHTQDKIMKFKRKVKINSRRMNKTFNNVEIRGINDVLKFNFLPLTLRLEDPDIPLYLHNKKMSVNRVTAQKTIPVNMILAINSHGEKIYHRYRLMINRNGIKKLKIMK